MKTFLVKVDDRKAYRQSANLVSELVDDAEPGERLVIRQETGLAQGAGGWRQTYAEPKLFYWDRFEADWAQLTPSMN